jgi:phosphotransferase system enzyme I (PtsI)
MSEEHRLDALAASPGIAIGTVHKYRRIRLETDSRTLDPAECDTHIERFRHALDLVEDELHRIASLARSEIGDDSSAIIETHIQMLRDPDMKKLVEMHIRKQLKTADAAVYDAFETFLKRLRAAGNSFFAERISDISDVRDRILYRLQHDASSHAPLKGSILVAEDLTPTEVVELSRLGLKAIVLVAGGLTSHASIIARSMSIPKLVACKGVNTAVSEGDTAIVDAKSGRFILHPSDATVAEYRIALEELIRHRADVESQSELPSITACGVEIALRANIEFEPELPHVKSYGAMGIGLLRTESFFMDAQLGTVASQQDFYEHAVEASGDHPVTIRLFDVGGDKITDLRESEANPFLGWRGIRILLDRKELLREQLRAVLGAAGTYPGRIRIMAPMVTLIDEVRELRLEVDRVQQERVMGGKPIDPDVPIGIMVEVPAVALQADLFADVSDFFSIGTNDLTQYTLAVDRGNPLISELYQHHHPAVYRLIRMTVDAAQRKGIPVAVCGELASDPDAAECLIGLGLRDLSMSPSSIPEVKARLRNRNCAEMRGKVAHIP